MAAGLIDTRTVGKLENFDGRADSWLDWSFRARAWFALLPVNGVDAGDVEAFIAAAEGHGGPLDEATMNPQAQTVSRVIYNVLVKVC